MSLPYARGEAKDWARAQMRGVCNVVMPTFTSDLRRLNREAIRHDVLRSAQLGFWGSLLASECGATREEMKGFIRTAAAPKPPGHHLVLHGSFDTVQDVIEMCRFGEANGCSAVLLSYPLTFYPKSAEEVHAYHAAVSAGTNLGIILFAIGFWGFRRLHPSGFPPEALARSVRLDTVIALKYECGQPGTGLAGPGRGPARIRALPGHRPGPRRRWPVDAQGAVASRYGIGRRSSPSRR